VWSAAFLTPLFAEYRVGLARVDITPPIGHEMGGYSARTHLNPDYDKTPLAEDAVEMMKQIGDKLGVEAVRVARGVKTVVPQNPRIQTKAVVLPILWATPTDISYLPTIAAAVRGGYGANSTVTPTEVGAGEGMLNTGLISI
jgi:hypothetical protein